jgi:hypothetical protein
VGGGGEFCVVDFLGETELLNRVTPRPRTAGRRLGRWPVRERALRLWSWHNE